MSGRPSHPARSGLARILPPVPMRALTRRPTRALPLMLARTLTLTLTLGLAVGISSPALAEIAPAVFQVVGGEYPEIALEVTLPGDLLKHGKTPTFGVTENGVPTEVVSAAPVAEGSRREPVQVVLLIDASGSMKGRPLDDAKAAAHRFIDEMGDQDRIAIVSFAWAPTVVTDFVSDRAVLSNAIDSVQASGETAVNDAVVKAAELAASAPGGHATLVLLSDGGDTVSINTLSAAETAIRNSGNPVFVVALESDEYDPQTLAGLASASGGRLLSAGNSNDLSAIYAGIARELTNRYLVIFKSAEPNTADLELDVTAALGDVSSTGSAVVNNPRYASGADLASAPEARTVKREPLAWSIVVLAAFAGSALLGLTVLDIAVPPRANLSRVEFYDQDSAEDAAGQDTRTSTLRTLVQDAVGYVAGKRGITRALQDKLQRAGIALRPVEYMYFHLLTVVILGLVTRLLTGSTGIAVLIIALATVAPLVALEMAISRRVRAFEEQLPDILGLLAGSLRAGWSISQAIGAVVEQMPPPASVEFQRVQTETRLGLPIEEGLRKMADRLDSENFRWVVSAIAIQREVGGNLAEVLDIVASTMRERAEVYRHVRSLTAEGRMSGVILMALPFVELGMLLLVNPRYISELFTTPLGIMLSVLGATLLLIGWVWLRRALKVEV